MEVGKNSPLVVSASPNKGKEIVCFGKLFLVGIEDAFAGFADCVESDLGNGHEAISETFSVIT